MKIAIFGIAGKMGKSVASLASREDDIEVLGGIEMEGHRLAGKKVSEICECEGDCGDVVVNPFDLLAKGVVAVDFTSPDSLEGILNACRKSGSPLVSGTTGLGKRHHDLLEAYSKKIPILWSPNMSYGIFVLCRLVELAGRLLDQDYDIEIVETHHRYKADAPSGTALKIAESVTEEAGGMLRIGRSSDTSRREPGEICIHSVRAGNITGEHRVIYSTIGETLELMHRAHSRDAFAKGAIMGARFIRRKRPGLYGLEDLFPKRKRRKRK
jgi:4-hydroxy-tetrahydrodipicolinate reductase